MRQVEGPRNTTHKPMNLSQIPPIDHPIIPHEGLCRNSELCAWEKSTTHDFHTVLSPSISLASFYSMSSSVCHFASGYHSLPYLPGKHSLTNSHHFTLDQGALLGGPDFNLLQLLPISRMDELPTRWEIELEVSLNGGRMMTVTRLIDT